MTNFLDIITWILIIYLLIGSVLGAYFFIKGLGKIDSGAIDASWKFKLIIFPSTVILWPVLFVKIIKR